MNKVKVVWVDLRFERGLEGLCGGMPEGYEALTVESAGAIQPAIAGSLPEFLCFEYDRPVVEQMEALRTTRLSWPGLPVLMFTEEHSEELAVWALRMRVWDYVVKPVSREELCVRLAVLVHAVEARQDAGRSEVFSKGAPSGREAGPAVDDRFGTAISFVEENLTEKISLHEVAELCGLGPFQFSRAFKQEQGTTFREFLIQRRINRALQLFDDPKASVTDVAFAAGFNDLSYFARVFRRFTGITPSLYRRDRGLREMLRLPMPEPPEPGPTEWPIAKYFYPSARKS
jgi:AraC-like DNA-binding protein/CheY-like chemotaxis protein